MEGEAKMVGCMVVNLARELGDPAEVKTGEVHPVVM